MLIKLALVCSLFFASTVTAAPLRLAVASNFADAMRALQKDYQAQSQTQLQISLGSSGKHFAQIQHGAPFDVFLAADSERPQRLEAEQLAVAGSRFTYAIGQLALWQPDATQKPQLPDLAPDHYLAIANPKLAPYGAAAVAYLSTQPSQHARLVYGENVAQSYHFAASRQAQMALLAYSLVHSRPATEYRLLPSADYPAIEQQAVVLRPSQAASAFVRYLKSQAAQNIIQAHGYLTPALQ